MPGLAARGEKLAPMVVAESTVEYLAPIFYPERVVVHLGIAAVGNSYFTLRYEIVKRPPAGAAAAAGKGAGEATPGGRGTARLVCIDPQTQKKANLAPALRQLLEANAERCAAGSTPPAGSASATASPEPTTAKRPATPSDDCEEWPLCWVHEVEYRDLDVNVHANNCAVYCAHSFDVRQL
jgi:acyl-CoA thioesterase FadM